MTQQFTASEVRDAITWKYGDKLTRISAMLHAFADLLEAQEKAMPAAWLRDSGVDIESEAACVTNTVRNLWLASNPKHIARYTIPLYNHPASPDAERLAEALQEILNYRGGAANALEDEYVVDRAHQALAAHSAQAQPPAARVTDAMVNAAMRADFCGHNVADALMCGTDWNTEVMRAALEAALAVQGNPNG